MVLSWLISHIHGDSRLLSQGHFRGQFLFEYCWPGAGAGEESAEDDGEEFPVFEELVWQVVHNPSDEGRAPRNRLSVDEKDQLHQEEDDRSAEVSYGPIMGDGTCWGTSGLTEPPCRHRHPGISGQPWLPPVWEQERAGCHHDSWSKGRGPDIFRTSESRKVKDFLLEYTPTSPESWNILWKILPPVVSYDSGKPVQNKILMVEIFHHSMRIRHHTPFWLTIMRFSHLALLV